MSVFCNLARSISLRETARPAKLLPTELIHDIEGGCVGDHVNIGLHGIETNREDDPLCIIPAWPLDAPVLQGPLTKDRREDLQILSFALAVSLVDDSGHPIGISPGEDPPDRVIHVSGRSKSIELTELTVSDVRHEFALARELGRTLCERLRNQPSHRLHLVGRRVALAMLPGEQLPRDTELLLDNLCVLLEEDRGYIGDGVDVTRGLPEHWPNDRGLYGQSGPVHVSVYPDGLPNEILVSAACQAEIRLSQTIHAVESRVRVKDSQASELLLMTCGLPDQRGYQCTPDTFMFQFIAENLEQIHLSPRHLKGIFLHLWGTPTWLQLYRSEDSVLWPTNARTGSLRHNSAPDAGSL